MSDALPTTANQLFGQYLCEKGKVHSDFHGDQPLTRELAATGLIAGVRARYYLAGGTTVPELYQFNVLQYFASLGIDSKGSLFNESLPITFLLGSFMFQVKTTYVGGEQRVGFRIDNDTTIESGTHIRGRFPPDYRRSIEDLINAGDITNDTPLRDALKQNVISILSSKTRDGTNGTPAGYGGGNMIQTFTWTERNNGSLACAVLADRSVFGWMWGPATVAIGPGLTWLEEQALDIQPWSNYEAETVDPLASLSK